MDEVDKGCPVISMAVSGCFFWYRPTWVVPDQQPLNSCVYVCMIAASILECIFVTVVLRRNSKETVQTLFWMYYVE